MIPLNIEKEHIVKAIREIDSNGFPSVRQSKKFLIRFEGKQYSPKYVLSLANKFVNGEELNPSSFNGGQETNNFLKNLEFEIVEISLSRAISESTSSHKKTIDGHQKRHDKNFDCKNPVEKMANMIDDNANNKFNIEKNTVRENHKENKQKDLNGWVATVIIQSNLDIGHSNDDRMNALSEIVNHIAKETSGDGVILFPCGWFYTGGKKPSTIYDWSEKAIKDILEEIDEHIIVCAGIDGMVDDEDYSHDQIAIAVSKGGIDAMGRKFYPSPQEAEQYLFSWEKIPGNNDGRLNEFLIQNFSIEWIKAAKINKNDDGKTIRVTNDTNFLSLTLNNKETNVYLEIDDGRTNRFIVKTENGELNIYVEHVKLAEDHLCEEDGKPRIFELNGVKYFMCVCYDTYGIRHKNIPNPNVDVVLNLVHCFYPRGVGPSGDTYFARHGFAGAAKQWDCPVFGAAVFFDRNIPECWPSGVYWNQGDKSTQKWKYEDNPIKSQNEFEVNIKEGIALVRIYDLEVI